MPTGALLFRHRAAAAGLAALLGLLLAACRPVPRADLVIHNGPEPETIDPQVLTGQADGRIASALFEGLTRFNPTNATALPGIAESWEISPDGRTYTFRLRPEARWSDGAPITAEDFVWSWRRAVDPMTAADYASQFFYVRNGEAINTGREPDVTRLGVEAAGPRTLRVELNEPTPFFLDLLASRIFAVIPRRTVEAHGDQWVRAPDLPTSGAFVLESWRVNDRIRLRRNPAYWDAANVRVEVVDILSGDSPNTALNLYLTGEVDYLIDKTLIPVELADQLVTRRDFHRFDYLGTYFLRFNCTRKPFDDVRVRRAIAMVVDRRRIVDRITRMGETPSASLVPRGTAGYDPAEGLAPDPAEARRLLAEAGYPEGRGFPTFSYAYNVGTRVHEQIAVELQAVLREELGLRMDIRPLEWKTYLVEMSKLNYDVIRGAWVGDYNDPNTFVDLFHSRSGNNRTGWASERFDRLLAEANATSDRGRRFALLREAEAMVVREELPILCLYTYVGLYAVDDERVGGVFPNLLDEHPISALYRKAPRVR